MTCVGLLSWRVDFDPEIVRLALVGELDMGGAALLVGAVDAVAAVSTSVLIDLAGVTFLDGGGLAVLMDLAAQLAARGITVAYGTTAISVDRYLDLTGGSLD